MSPTGDLLVTSLFAGKCLHELAQKPSRVALAWHQASGSTPYWGNFDRHARMLLSTQVLKFANHINSPVAVLTVKEHNLFFQHHICADAEPMQVPRGSKTITPRPLQGLAERKKADSTLSASQPVPQASTRRALHCLTSEVERDPVHSVRYGRQRI